jgi:uncharacterized phage protein (TIGR01671 family)
MREIKFRGKRKDDGLWIYGYYSYKWRTQQHYIRCSPDQGMMTDAEFEVIPETVGQFTGLKDKDGKEVFEGDIFKCPDFYGGKFAYAGEWIEDYEDLIEEITFSEGSFFVGDMPLHAIFDKETFEVIGNIYENPEFLKP